MADAVSDLLQQYYGTPDSLGGNVQPRTHQPNQPPQLGQHNAIDRLLTLYGQESADAVQRGLEGNATPQEVTHAYFAGLFGPPIGPFGMASTFRRSPDLPAIWQHAHPSTSVQARVAGERPLRPSTAYGDDVFMSPTIHGAEYDDALSRLGLPRITELRESGRIRDGWSTSSGRFLDRQEANTLADTALGRLQGGGNSIGLESYALLEQIERAYERAKAAGNHSVLPGLRQQYQDMLRRVESDMPVRRPMMQYETND